MNAALNVEPWILVREYAVMIPILIIWIGCWHYWRRRRSSQANLMLIGSSIRLIGFLVYAAIFFKPSDAWMNAMTRGNWANHSADIIFFPNIIGYYLFAGGFLIMIIKQSGVNSRESTWEIGSGR